MVAAAACSMLLCAAVKQTGKSYVLDAIVPAVVRRHPEFGDGALRELTVIRINGEAVLSDSEQARQGTLRSSLPSLY